MTEIMFVEESPMAGVERALTAGATIGRHGCDVVLADPEVSRRHARIRQVDTGPAVEDIGSSNGTFVNDKKISGITLLSTGDRVRFGNTVWRVTSSGQGATAAGGEVGASAADQDRAPSALRRAVPVQAVYGEVPQFDSGPAPRPILGRSAARRIEATVLSYLVVLSAAGGVVFFFAQR